MAAMIPAAVATLSPAFHFSAPRSAATGGSSPSAAMPSNEYPASVTASRKSATLAAPGKYSTVARSVARFTVAPLTPSSPASAPST